MEIRFVGVGECCDINHPNTSFQVKTSDGQYLLFDCGFSTPWLYFRHCADGNELDLIWISHFHGDHFFGLPLLFLRLWEMGREKPLKIYGQAGGWDKISQTMELAFPGFADKMTYPLIYTGVEPGTPVLDGSLKWQAAEARHSVRSLAIRLDDDHHSLFYSGDGGATSATMTIASGCDLVIHESFWLDQDSIGHGSVVDSLAFAAKVGAGKLALVHLQRQVRSEQITIVEEMIKKSGLDAWLPRAGEQLSLPDRYLTENI